MQIELRELMHLGETTGGLALCPPASRVLSDERFQQGIAAASHHPEAHQRPGGLLTHTLEVAREAIRLAGDDKQLAARAYVAAVFHDYGKIHEYLWIHHERKVKKLPFGKRLGHITWGWCVFVTFTAGVCCLTAEDKEEIGHAILAHHGRLEWGSPVEPQTRLAYIIHTADMLSAKGLASCC